MMAALLEPEEPELQRVHLTSLFSPLQPQHYHLLLLLSLGAALVGAALVVAALVGAVLVAVVSVALVVVVLVAVAAA